MPSSGSKEKLYDVRIFERNIDAGLLTKKEFDKYLKDLPDFTENMTWCETNIPGEPKEEENEESTEEQVTKDNDN